MQLWSLRVKAQIKGFLTSCAVAMVTFNVGKMVTNNWLFV